MNWMNPLTGDEYQDALEYVDALIAAWHKVQVRKHQVANAEAAVIAALDEAAGEQQTQTGVVRLHGTAEVVKLTRRQNVRYEKERGARHPLSVLMNRYSALLPLVRVDYAESGEKLRKLLEKVSAGQGTEEEAELAAELEKVRVTTPGKPGVSTEPRKDVEQPPPKDAVNLEPMGW